MARLHTIDSLLENVLREGASEIHISSGHLPQMIIKNEEVAVSANTTTHDNITNLLHNLATVDQMKELNACGDVRFIFLFRNWARFSVAASMTNDSVCIVIRNLGR